MSDRVEVLDWTRGIAAVSVMWYHLATADHMFGHTWISASGQLGWLGVEAFFVISGFVVPLAMHRESYGGRRDFGRFLLKRSIRIEPPYLATVLLILAIGYCIRFIPGFRGAPAHFDPVTVLLHVGYLNSLFGRPWLNPAFWTLCVEFQFYLSMALVYPLLSSRRASLRLAAICAMAALAFVPGVAWTMLPYLGLFALGGVAFQYRARLIGAPLFVTLVVALGAVNAIALSPAHAIVGVVTALLAAFVRVPRIAPLAILGALSYSLYLVHGPVGGRVAGIILGHLHGPLTPIVALSGGIAASFMAAAALYWLVERPARRAAGRLRYRRVQARLQPEAMAAPGLVGAE